MTLTMAATLFVPVDRPAAFAVAWRPILKSLRLPTVVAVTVCVSVQYVAPAFFRIDVGSVEHAAGVLTFEPFIENWYAMLVRSMLPVFFTRTLYVTVAPSLNWR